MPCAPIHRTAMSGQSRKPAPSPLTEITQKSRQNRLSSPHPSQKSSQPEHSKPLNPNDRVADSFHPTAIMKSAKKKNDGPRGYLRGHLFCLQYFSNKSFNFYILQTVTTCNRNKTNNLPPKYQNNFLIRKSEPKVPVSNTLHEKREEGYPPRYRSPPNPKGSAPN